VRYIDIGRWLSRGLPAGLVALGVHVQSRRVALRCRREPLVCPLEIGEQTFLAFLFFFSLVVFGFRLGFRFLGLTRFRFSLFSNETTLSSRCPFLSSAIASPSAICVSASVF